MSIAPYAQTSIELTRLNIMERLKSAERLKGRQMARGPLTDAQRATTDTEGLVNGYGIVNFGGRGRVGQGMQGITGTRNDLRRFVFGVEVYSRSSTDRDRLADDVWDTLEGFEPYNCGEVSGEFSGEIASPLAVKQNIVREGVGLVFYCYIGTITEDLEAPVNPGNRQQLIPSTEFPGYSDLIGATPVDGLPGYHILEVEK